MNNDSIPIIYSTQQPFGAIVPVRPCGEITATCGCIPLFALVFFTVFPFILIDKIQPMSMHLLQPLSLYFDTSCCWRDSVVTDLHHAAIVFRLQPTVRATWRLRGIYVFDSIRRSREDVTASFTRDLWAFACFSLEINIHSSKVLWKLQVRKNSLATIMRAKYVTFQVNRSLLIP